MTTAKTAMNITHVIDKNNITVYNATTSKPKLHLEITTVDGIKLINTATTVLPQVAPINGVGGSNGLITFSNVALTLGNNSIKMYLSSADDLDGVGVTLTKLGSTSIRRIDDSATIVTL